MGSNLNGQLGLSDNLLEMKSSPVLIDSLLNLKPIAVSCGSYHTIVIT